MFKQINTDLSTQKGQCEGQTEDVLLSLVRDDPVDVTLPPGLSFQGCSVPFTPTLKLPRAGTAGHISLLLAQEEGQHHLAGDP